MTDIDLVMKPTEAAAAHLSMGKVVLTVNDLARVRGFYEQVVGLQLLRGDGEADAPPAGDAGDEGGLAGERQGRRGGEHAMPFGRTLGRSIHSESARRRTGW